MRRVLSRIKLLRGFPEPRRLWRCIGSSWMIDRLRWKCLVCQRYISLSFPQGFPGFIHRSVYLEAELEKLQIQLGAKRRVGLLLGVLERKESLRVKRFEEITRLLDKLRCARDFCEGLHYCDTYILVC